MPPFHDLLLSGGEPSLREDLSIRFSPRAMLWEIPKSYLSRYFW
ncbi:MAG: hypothetical protein V3U74_00970 [Thermodesulfobacteriota bacterium]